MGAIQPKLIIGLGASAGGLNEYKKFFSSVAPDTGMAFVVIQHLDPSRESRIPEILQRHTDMTVMRIEDGVIPAPNHVYTIPSNKIVEYVDGRLVLRDREPRPDRRTIDRFFTSLAKGAEQRAVAVVLSGAGSDGTLGLREVRAAGGLTLAQTEQEATHRGMPASAARAGVADFIVPTAEMPGILERYARHSYAERGQLLAAASQADGPGPSDATAGVEHAAFDADFQSLRALLKSRESFDLNKYKQGTVKRRLARRLGLAGVDSLSHYIDRLRDERDERKALVGDILIGVTEFFRDPTAFEALEAEIVIPLVERAHDEKRAVRVWSAGCSTGEEAYSLAMMVLDAADGLNLDIDLQLFATDTNEDAIAHARRGVYSRSLLQNLSEGQRVKYFEAVDENLMQVRQDLRDHISFAQHDLTRDPPFSRMDLISCRNVLIYLQPEVQEKIQRDLHFALRLDGHLFLGTADALSTDKQAFQVISSQWRIYGKKRMPADTRGLDSFVRRIGMGRAGQSPDESPSARPSVGETSRTALLNTFVPASLVIAEDGNVLYTHGDVARFVKLPSGEPDLHISKMLSEELRTRVMAAIYKARRDLGSVEVEARSDDGQTSTRVRVHPASSDDFPEGCVLLAFEQNKLSEPQIAVRDDDSVSREIERELESTREALRTTVEELETSNEQLRSSHEEALSMNEELQSTNEELEATSEELRSMNEELVTVNEQLQDKINELKRANEDLSNFMASTKLATVFLDEELCIRRFTPAAAKLLDLNHGHDGQSVRDLRRELLAFDLGADAEAVLDQLATRERRIDTSDGKHYQRHVLPYRTQDNRIRGVVVAFNDITTLHRAQQTLKSREAQQQTIAQLSWQALTFDSVDALANNLVHALRDTLDIDCCGVFRPIDHEQMALDCASGFDAETKDRLSASLGGDSFLTYASRAQRAVTVENLAEDPRFNLSSELAEMGATSAIGVTISGNGSPPSVLCAFSAEQRAFSTDLVEFFSSVAGILSVARERAHAQEQLRQSEQQSRQRLEQIDTIYRTAPVGLAVVDRNATIVKLNRRLAQAAGYEADASEGMGLLDVLPEGLRDEFQTRLQQVFDLAKPVVNAEVVADDAPGDNIGDSLAWECSFAPLTTADDGTVEQISCVFHDVTERRRHKRELEKAAQELECASRQKDRFLAMLGHELRNPLAAITSAVELQQQVDSANAVVERTREVLDRQTTHMAGIVDRLLDNSQLTRGKLSVETEPLDLASVFEEVIERHTGLDERDLSLELSLCDKPLTVMGDRVRLVEVFDNLISNAIDHSPPGSCIEVVAERDDDELEIRVQDEGDGIAPEVADTLFEPFVQGEQPISRDQGGLGLGLSLAKGLVALHGGELEAHNNDRGACFTVRLLRSDVQLDEEARSKAPTPAIDGRRLVIVEDNADARTLLAETLQLHGHLVETADTGKALLDVLDGGFRPHVIVCDIGLPGDMDGYDIARKLRSEDQWQDVVLVALTGYGSPGNKNDAVEAGFDHHMTKPADVDALNELISNADA